MPWPSRHSKYAASAHRSLRSSWLTSWPGLHLVARSPSFSYWESVEEQLVKSHLFILIQFRKHSSNPLMSLEGSADSTATFDFVSDLQWLQYYNVFLMLFCNNLTSAWKTRSQAPAKYHKNYPNSKDSFDLPFVLLSNITFFCPVHFWMCNYLWSRDMEGAWPVASANCSTSRGAFPLPCHPHRRPCPTGSYRAPGIWAGLLTRWWWPCMEAIQNEPRSSENLREMRISKLMQNLLVSFVEMAIPFFQFPPHITQKGHDIQNFANTLGSPASLLGLPGSMAWDRPNCVHSPPLHAWPRGVRPAHFQFEQPCAMVFPCQEGQET